MGAAAVFETAAATPESMKFSKKPNFFLSAIVVWFLLSCLEKEI